MEWCQERYFHLQQAHISGRQPAEPSYMLVATNAPSFPSAEFDIRKFVFPKGKRGIAQTTQQQEPAKRKQRGKEEKDKEQSETGRVESGTDATTSSSSSPPLDAATSDAPVSSVDEFLCYFNSCLADEGHPEKSSSVPLKKRKLPAEPVDTDPTAKKAIVSDAHGQEMMESTNETVGASTSITVTALPTTSVSIPSNGSAASAVNTTTSRASEDANLNDFGASVGILASIPFYDEVNRTPEKSARELSLIHI